METFAMSNAAVDTRSASEPIEVSRKDLPLSCPLPDAPVWNMHPRVYLPIEDEPTGEVVCPYCGARYRLK
jgi:uncharacterized Zn-finger protein